MSRQIDPILTDAENHTIIEALRLLQRSDYAPPEFIKDARLLAPDEIDDLVSYLNECTTPGVVAEG